MQGFVIAIDGPVASGKGTIAPLLATKLNAFYMNTGALFRMIGLSCYEQGIDLSSEEEVLHHLASLSLDLRGDQNLLNGKDVSDRIFHADISRYSSLVASLPKVHAKVITIEQAIAQKNIDEGRIVILEGRNIGTDVFPNAALKLFLTASVEQRSQRRYEQAKLRGEAITYEEVLQDTKIRDERDQSRKFFPLTSQPKERGYTVLDNTGLTEEETLSKIMIELHDRKLL